MALFINTNETSKCDRCVDFVKSPFIASYFIRALYCIIIKSKDHSDIARSKKLSHRRGTAGADRLTDGRTNKRGYTALYHSVVL